MGKKVSKEKEGEKEKLSAKDFATRVVSMMSDYMDTPEYLKNEVSALRATSNVQLSSINTNANDIAVIKQEMIEPIKGRRLWAGIEGRDQEVYEQIKAEFIEPLEKKIEQQEKLIDRLLSLVEKQSKQIDTIAKKADKTEEDLAILQTLVMANSWQRGQSNPQPFKPYFTNDPTLDGGKIMCGGNDNLFQTLKQEYQKDELA